MTFFLIVVRYEGSPGASPSAGFNRAEHHFSPKSFLKYSIKFLLRNEKKNINILMTFTDSYDEYLIETKAVASTLEGIPAAESHFGPSDASINNGLSQAVRRQGT